MGSIRLLILTNKFYNNPNSPTFMDSIFQIIFNPT